MRCKQVQEETTPSQNTKPPPPAQWLPFPRVMQVFVWIKAYTSFKK
jgi:hypothetical protein